MRIIEDKERKHRVMRFESLTDFYELAEKKLSGDALGSGSFTEGNRSSITGDPYFTGTESVEQATQLAKDGWHEIATEVRNQVGKIDSQLRNMVVNDLVLSYEVSGGAVDIDRYLTGEPECMLEAHLAPVAKHGRVVTVLYNFTASAIVSKETMIKRGVVLLALCELLRLSGMSLEIWAESKVTHAGSGGRKDLDHHSVLVNVLRAGEPIDIDSLMYPLAHPSLLRRHSFAVEEHEPIDVKQRFGIQCGGYGRPSFDSMCSEMVGADISITSGLAAGDPIVADPIAWLTTELTNLGLIQ